MLISLLLICFFNILFIIMLFICSCIRYLYAFDAFNMLFICFWPCSWKCFYMLFICSFYVLFTCFWYAILYAFTCFLICFVICFWYALYMRLYMLFICFLYAFYMLFICFLHAFYMLFLYAFYMLLYAFHMPLTCLHGVHFKSPKYKLPSRDHCFFVSSSMYQCVHKIGWCCFCMCICECCIATVHMCAANPCGAHCFRDQ